MQKNLNDFIWFEEPKKQSATQMTLKTRDKVSKTKSIQIQDKICKYDGCDPQREQKRNNKRSSQWQTTVKFSVLYHIFKNMENGNMFTKQEGKHPSGDFFRKKLRLLLTRIM